MKRIEDTTPYKTAEYSRKWCERNREKNKEYNRQWRAKGGAKQMRAKELVKKYWPGLTNDEALEEYQAWFDEQNGKCAVCNTHQDKLGQTLAVDHCHETMQVRGLLCFNCNIGIGKLGDTYKDLVKAAKYLWKFEQDVKESI